MNGQGEFSVVRVRSGRGEVTRAELLDVRDGRAKVRFLKEVDGRTPVSWIAVKRLIDGLPGQGAL